MSFTIIPGSSGRHEVIAGEHPLWDVTPVVDLASAAQGALPRMLDAGHLIGRDENGPAAWRGSRAGRIEVVLSWGIKGTPGNGGPLPIRRRSG